MISNNSDYPPQLWNCINRTFHRKTTNSLSNYFSSHFKDKLTQIDASFQFSVSSYNIDFPAAHHPCPVFKSASLTEVSKLIP